MELAHPRAPRHEVDLHVLQRHEHGLHHRRRVEELLQGKVEIVAEGEGELNFEFDNSSSWFNGRAVQCTFSVAEPAAGDAAGKELEHQLMKAPDGSYTLWYQ